jgi:hypothetical protein
VYDSSFWCYRYLYRDSTKKDGQPTNWTDTPDYPSDLTGVDGIAIQKASFGRGAERVVFLCREFSYRSSPEYGQKLCVFVGPELVAKESRYVDGETKKMDFHDVFCKTQSKAQTYADAFNSRISALCGGRELLRIEFLACSVFALALPGDVDAYGNNPSHLDDPYEPHEPPHDPSNPDRPA